MRAYNTPVTSRVLRAHIAYVTGYLATVQFLTNVAVDTRATININYQFNAFKMNGP